MSSLKSASCFTDPDAVETYDDNDDGGDAADKSTCSMPLTMPSIKKAPSTGAVNDPGCEPIWARSQSEVNLTFMKVAATSPTKDDEKSLVSEQARVYWDLPEAVKVEENEEDQQDGSPTANHTPADGVGGGGLRITALETIQQKEELTEFSCSTECLTTTGMKIGGGGSGQQSPSFRAAGVGNNMSNSCTKLYSAPSAKSSQQLHQRAASYTLSTGGINSLGGAGHNVRSADFTSMHTVGSHLHNNQQGDVPNGGCREVLAGGSYFCESDFDDSREQRPNYMVRIKAMEEAMLTQLARLKGEGVSMEEQCQALDECEQLIRRAWEMPLYGRDCATTLCDLVRREGGLEFLAFRLTRTQLPTCEEIADDEEGYDDNSDCSPEHRLLLRVASLFSQVLTQENLDDLLEMESDGGSGGECECDAEDSGATAVTRGEATGRLVLNEVVRRSWQVKEDVALATAFVAILEGMLKHCESTCRLVVANGGLRSLIYACRSSNPLMLRHAAIALANLSLYGGADNQSEMVVNRVADWLFPLAFHFDDVIQYYACLAIVVLSSNRELSQAVDSSGTLKLVLPFVRSHSPAEFACCEPSHLQGRSSSWLQRLLPALLSEREEARALVAFHFAMEAKIKREQRKTQIFHEIGAVEILRRVAASPCYLASTLAGQALEHIGEEVPYQLSAQVPLWNETDVQYWLIRNGFKDVAGLFASVHVDGDILLRLTDTSLRDDLEVTNGITRKRLQRELKKLKSTASYRSCDRTRLDQWLRDLVGENFSQYTYTMLAAGVDRPFLPRLTDRMLATDCGVENGVHRDQILHAIQGSNEIISSCNQERTSQQLADSLPSLLPASATMLGAPIVTSVGVSAPPRVASEDDLQHPRPSLPSLLGLNKSLDAFISYRRSNGSQLASLLKVHLQLRGLRVFLDIERLSAGKFDESLLRSIRQAHNFLLVLTPSSLERCQDDPERNDWLHKEIVCALDSQCNIIPVTDRFDWPPAETLPEDMRAVVSYNSVNWIHDYQDACVDKLEKFMKKPIESSPFSPPRPYRTHSFMGATPCPCCLDRAGAGGIHGQPPPTEHRHTTGRMRNSRRITE